MSNNSILDFQDFEIEEKIVENLENNFSIYNLFFKVFYILVVIIALFFVKLILKKSKI